jgi:hypothetical protein
MSPDSTDTPGTGGDKCPADADDRSGASVVAAARTAASTPMWQMARDKQMVRFMLDLLSGRPALLHEMRLCKAPQLI